MARPKTNPVYGKRAAELVRQAYQMDNGGMTFNDWLEDQGLRYANYYLWWQGYTAPSVEVLARMAELGYDVMYVLTGKRRAASDAGTSKAAKDPGDL
jgi:hypothetical protein